MIPRFMSWHRKAHNGMIWGQLSTVRAQLLLGVLIFNSIGSPPCAAADHNPGDRSDNKILSSRDKNHAYVIHKGDGQVVIDCAIKEFDQKIRLVGFSLSRYSDLRERMTQAGSTLVVDLGGKDRLSILNADAASVRSDAFQLELDRTNLKLTFVDDFNEFSWDPEDNSGMTGTWRTNYGYVKPSDMDSRTLVSNKELEIYTDPLFRGTAEKPLNLNPFRIDHGVLEIVAQPLPDSLQAYVWGRKYSSGLITTKKSFSQLYGVFEIRARIPKGRGLWPAFWLLPVSGAWPPELDVFEVLGHDTSTLYASWHSLVDGKHLSESGAVNLPDLSLDFHTYAVDWEKDKIQWYFDGNEIFRRPTPEGMHQPMYILLNLGVGGGWPGNPDASTPFPAVYAIDWIRVFHNSGIK
jgi:beta-glucanase (GH16 family)